MTKPSKPDAPQAGKADGNMPSKPVQPGPSTAVMVPEAGSEPTVGRASVPVLLIAFLGALVYWGSMYIVEYGGQADARVHYPYTSFKEIQELQPKGEEEILKNKGLLVYGKICVACHQSDGNGSPSQNAPPLAGSEWVLARDPSRIIRIVLHGLSGPVSVKGKEWGAGQMLAWKDILTDEDIAFALTYVRNSWGNKAPVVKAEQVKKVREETKDWSGYMTAEELSKVTLKE